MPAPTVIASPTHREHERHGRDRKTLQRAECRVTSAHFGRSAAALSAAATARRMRSILERHRLTSAYSEIRWVESRYPGESLEPRLGDAIRCAMSCSPSLSNIHNLEARSLGVASLLQPSARPIATRRISSSEASECWGAVLAERYVRVIYPAVHRYDAHPRMCRLKSQPLAAATIDAFRRCRRSRGDAALEVRRKTGGLHLNRLGNTFHTWPRVDIVRSGAPRATPPWRQF
jgi:hypothetical protein